MRSLFPGLTCALVAGLSLLVGCQPVREDRNINFSQNGKDVGFQHGKEGVFVADAQGQGLKKIFEPADDALAVSSPLFSPTDSRLIFTTAKAATGSATTVITNPFDPAGALHTQQPVEYTCWLRAAKDDATPEPLFTAHCDHVGYVAANLAVRWHPKGDRLHFLDHTADQQHGVFEFDLTKKSKRQVFPRSAAAIVFDWAPDTEHLVCVLGQAVRNPDLEGIWIGKPGNAAWWHVPESSVLAEGELPSLIEQLRATRPAWTADGQRFAFASFQPAEPNQAPKHLLRTGNLAMRTVQTRVQAAEPFRDLHWAPDGRLGVVIGKEHGSLHVMTDGVLSPPLNSRAVRRFAGWHSSGSHLAYVAPDNIPFQDENWNAFLFVPDPLARDAVFLAAGDSYEANREVLSGMRVTFPQWSPTEEKLSLWATFAPTHRSWLGVVLGSALRPCDPAAIVDLATGNLGWMPVNAHEKAQVGNYHLLKRDFAEAWRWYEQARRDQAQAKPTVEDFSFFEFYCLTKLGRGTEAQAKLDEFREVFKPSFAAVARTPIQGLLLGGRSAEEWIQDLGDPKSISGQLLRDLYEAEVFLSLDAAADGELFFRQELDAAVSNVERFSHAVVLAQLLLLQKKHRDYAELTANTLAPLLLKMWDPAAPEQIKTILDLERVQQLVLMAAAGLTLLPLADADFLSNLPDQELVAILPDLKALAAKAKDDFSHTGSQLLLFAVARKLGLEKERQEAAAALTGFKNDFDERVHELFEQGRTLLRGLTATR